MKAWVVGTPGPMDDEPLELVDRPVPEPGPGEVRVRVSTCGVCRTDLHLAEGDLPPHRPGDGARATRWSASSTPLGPGASGFGPGDRVGIAWLRHTCGRCRFCRRGDENLCLDPRFTGWDADGGYAEYAVVDEGYAYRLPDGVRRRARRPAAVRRDHRLPGAAPRPSCRPAGGSASTASAPRPTWPPRSPSPRARTVHVLTRSEAARRLALELGAASAGPRRRAPPEPLDAAILFAPAGELVPVGPGRARPGRHAGRRRHPPDRHPAARLRAPPVPGAPAAQRHRQHPRPTARSSWRSPARLGLRVATTPYPLDEADRALADLAADRVTGAAVLVA